MPDANGNLTLNDKVGRPVIIVYETQSGVTAHITPVGLNTLRAVQAKAAELHPYPDEADDAARQQVDIVRSEWTDWSIFNYTVAWPEYPTRESLIQAFAVQLMALRKMAVLPDDDYTAIVKNVVLSWSSATVENGKYVPVGSEYTRIIRAALQLYKLVPIEDAPSGARFFRALLPEDKIQ